jgi:phage terminase large subunit
MEWPPDYDAILMQRMERFHWLKSDIEALSLAVHHYGQMDAQSCIDFINHWGITFDPRVRPPMPRMLPFILFPRQEEFVHFVIGCLKDRENGLAEKCRDVGATWECCHIAAWLWRFHSGSTVGFGSLLAHNIDDRGNPKSIFLKIRQAIKAWPYFLRPHGLNERRDMPLMKILHPPGTDDATIIGEGGDNVGRGGRTSIYFKDESAHYERPELIEAALGDNTDVQIDISSVNGTNNIFYRKRQAGEIWERGREMTPGMTRIFIFDWRDHPGKTQEWYDKRRARAEREGMLHIFAQEVERNYNASSERIIIPAEWVEAAIDAHKTLRIPVVGEKIGGQDVADDGGDKNALVIRQGIVIRFAEHWGGDAGMAAEVALPACVEYGVEELYYDSIGVGAAFKNEINNMKKKVDEKGQKTFPRKLLVMPWDAGSSPLDPTDNIIPGDDQSPTNEDQYVNLKAQAWFRMRARFYKTFRMVRHGQHYPFNELISLDSTMPRLHELKNELSQAQHKKSEVNGKTIVDKKPKGASSPNLADAAIMCFNPTRELSIYDVL